MEAIDDFMDYQMQYSRPGVTLPQPEPFHRQYQEYHPPPPLTSLQQPQQQQQQQQQQQPSVCPALRDHSLCPYPHHYNPHNLHSSYHVGQSSSRSHNTYPFDPVYHSSGASLPWPTPTQLAYHSWSPTRPLGNRSSFPPTARQSVPQQYPTNTIQNTSGVGSAVNSNSNVSAGSQAAHPLTTSSQAQSLGDQPQSTTSREQSNSHSTLQYQQGPRFGDVPSTVNMASTTSGPNQHAHDGSRTYVTGNVGPPSAAPTRPTGSVNLPALGSTSYIAPRLPQQPLRQYGGRVDYWVDAGPSTTDRRTASPRASMTTSESPNVPAARSAAESDYDSEEELSEHALRAAAELSGSGPSSDDIAAQRIRAEQVLRGQLSNCKRIASKKALASLESVEIDSLPESERLCMICYNDFGVASPEGVNEAPLRLPKCKHVFGDHCIKKWFTESDSCPYCRDKLPSVMQHPLADPRVRAYITNLGHLGRHPPYNHRRPGDTTRVPAALQGSGNTSSAATLAMLRTMGAVDLGRAASAGDRRLSPSDVSEARRRTRLRLDNIRDAGAGPGSELPSNGRPRSFTGTSGVRFGSSAPSQTLPPSHPQSQIQPQVQGGIPAQTQHRQPPVQGRDAYSIEAYQGPAPTANPSHSRQASLDMNLPMIITDRAAHPQFLPEPRPQQQQQPPHTFPPFSGASIPNVRMSEPQPTEQAYMMDIDSEVLTTNVNEYRPFPSQPVYMGGPNNNRPLDAWS